MAKLYSNENFPMRAVRELRVLGHDVLTSLEAGRANQKIPDDKVLQTATELQRAVLTLNRRDFFVLHRASAGRHSGIITCTTDPNVAALAMRIHDAIAVSTSLNGALIRIVRPG